MLTRSCPPNKPFVVSQHVTDNLAAHLFPLFGTSDCSTAESVYRKKHVSTQWNLFCKSNPTHPTVVCLTETPGGFLCTGYGIFSLLLPNSCTYTSNKKSDDSQQVVVHHGILVQGTIDNAMIGSSGNGLLAHIAQYHGRHEAIGFIDRIQVAAALLSFQYSPTFSLYDCITLPSPVVTCMQQDIKSEVMRAALVRMNTDNTCPNQPEQARKSALAILMRAKEWSEGTISQWDTDHTVFVFRAPVSPGSVSTTQGTCASCSEIANLSRRENHSTKDTLFHQPSTQSGGVAGMHYAGWHMHPPIVNSKCKGTAAGLGQIFCALGQQALPPFMCVTESTYGRTQALYRNPHMAACFRPSSFSTIVAVYYADRAPNSTNNAESTKNRTLFHYGNQAPPLPPPCTLETPIQHLDTELYHTQRLVQHSNVPARLRHAIKGVAYKESIYERTASSASVQEMQVHLEHQGFTAPHTRICVIGASSGVWFSAWSESTVPSSLGCTTIQQMWRVPTCLLCTCKSCCNRFFDIKWGATYIGLHCCPHNGYTLRSATQAMQDVRTEYNLGMYSPNGWVSPAVTLTNTDPRYEQHVGNGRPAQFIDVRKLADLINAEYDIQKNI